MDFVNKEMKNWVIGWYCHRYPIYQRLHDMVLYRALFGNRIALLFTKILEKLAIIGYYIRRFQK